MHLFSSICFRCRVCLSLSRIYDTSVFIDAFANKKFKLYENVGEAEPSIKMILPTNSPSANHGKNETKHWTLCVASAAISSIFKYVSGSDSFSLSLFLSRFRV